MAATAELEERVEFLEGQVSAFKGRQDMIASNLTEVRKATRRIEDHLLKANNWQGITELRLDLLEQGQKRVEEKLVSMGDRLDDLDENYGALNEKVAVLDSKVQGLDTKVQGLDKKVGLLTDDVGEIKAGQVVLQDMVATLLARSEGVDNRN